MESWYLLSFPYTDQEAVLVHEGEFVTSHQFLSLVVSIPVLLITVQLPSPALSKFF